MFASFPFKHLCPHLTSSHPLHMASLRSLTLLVRLISLIFHIPSLAFLHIIFLPLASLHLLLSLRTSHTFCIPYLAHPPLPSPALCFLSSPSFFHCLHFPSRLFNLTSISLVFHSCTFTLLSIFFYAVSFFFPFLSHSFSFSSFLSLPFPLLLFFVLSFSFLPFPSLLRPLVHFPSLHSLGISGSGRPTARFVTLHTRLVTSSLTPALSHT